MEYSTVLQCRRQTCWATVSTRALWNCWLVLAPLLTFAIALESLANAAVAQATVINREYAIKAAFLYHFLGYVDWPDEVDQQTELPFVIGVFETDPFGSALDNLAKTKTVGGRSIDIRRLSSTQAARECHIVFVPRTVSEVTQSRLLLSLNETHVLTVGETEDFIDRGGVAQFYLEGNKVRFAFNIDLVQNRNLKISSKLLGLAKIVSKE